jgi:hypothetical protein
MKEFLNPKSMLTPGIAGALTMLITNTLNQQFQLPGKWIALGLSFLLGTLVFSDKKTVIWQKILLYVFNSLIIFSMAAGTNIAGRATLKPPRSTIQEFMSLDVKPVEPQSFFEDWFDR